MRKGLCAVLRLAAKAERMTHARRHSLNNSAHVSCYVGNEDSAGGF
jgi:hypothetical protein